MSTQLIKIEKHLRRNNKGSGITAAKLAKLAGVSKDAVYRRVYDLREVYGHQIYSNYRNVNGQRKLYYRMAG